MCKVHINAACMPRVPFHWGFCITIILVYSVTKHQRKKSALFAIICCAVLSSALLWTIQFPNMAHSWQQYSTHYTKENGGSVSAMLRSVWLGHGEDCQRKRRYSLLSLGKEARPLRDTTNLRFAEPVSTAELENAAKGPSSSTDSVPSDLLMSHDADLVYAVSCISHFQLICHSLHLSNSVV